MRTSLINILLLCGLSVSAQDNLQQLTFKINKKYLNLPVQMSEEKGQMTIKLGDEVVRYLDIRLSASEPDYWVYADVSEFVGKEITITYTTQVKGFSSIYQSDSWAGEDSVYKETLRPQFHFTSKRGWLNDPNGLVYYNGEYHLYYQHNPYGIQSSNKHWGHAVSKDLLHWQELGDALYPDEMGQMYSGTAVIDYNNTAGFQTGEQPALITAYTASKKVGEKDYLETQCIAYSNDNGRTFTKFEGNPVISSKAKWNSPDTRDPKIFWYEPTQKWIMVLFEKNGHSFYNSDNLKDWTYQSHIVGFWECPEFFELPVDGDSNNKKWVIYGASGTYIVGDFDGEKFIPTSGKHQYIQGNFFAAQTFNNIPSTDGRRIQIGWSRDMWFNGMPFSQMMSFPTELTLRTTKHGIRLFNEPIEEVKELHKKSHSWENLSTRIANEKLKTIDGDLFHVKMKVTVHNGPFLLIRYNGNDLLAYDLNYNTINGHFYQNADPQSRSITFELLIDRTSVEIFADQGAYSFISSLNDPNNKDGLSFLENKDIEIESLEVHLLKSIWK